MFLDVAYTLIVEARVAKGANLGDTLEKLAEYAGRTLRREETAAERSALAIARRNTANMKKLASLGF